MKKYLFIAVAALAASVACTEVNTEGPKRVVKFSAANYVPQTKAVSVLNDFESFQCRAFMHAEGVDLNSDGSIKTPATYQEFFGASGETILPDNVSAPAEWAPAHDYYWPKGTQSFVNFVGWYGTDGTNAINPTISYAYTSSKWTATMEWDFSTTLGSASTNLLYADMAWRFKDNNNPATYGVSTAVSEGVPMLFHHALAQINIKAYASGTSLAKGSGADAGKVQDGVAKWTITLENAKITPVYSDGSLTLTNEDPGSKGVQAWTGNWVGDGTAGDVNITTYNVTEISKATAGDMVAASCVLPQTIGASVVLSFDMRIVTDYGNSVSNTELLPISIKLNDMGTSAWEQNHKYTYYIKIVPSQNEVLFDPALDADWVVEADVEEEI